MSKFLIFFIFGLVITTFADDYRPFTDKDGRTIKAKVIKVDMQTKKVTLERENKKKATVTISIFSESDQKYIRSWSPTSKPEEPKSDKPEPTPITLSKSDAIAILKRYEDASKKAESKHGTCAEVVALFDNKTVEDLRKAGSLPDRRRAMEQVKLKKVDGPYLRIEIRFSDVSNSEYETFHPKINGYIYLLENGQIKYDPLYFQHPLQRAFNIIQHMEYLCIRQARLLDENGSEDSENAEDMKWFNGIWNIKLNLLNETGIPSFGLNKDQSAYEQKESLKKCITWLVEESRTWDTGEPKIPLPKELFEELLDISGFK